MSEGHGVERRGGRKAAVRKSRELEALRRDGKARKESEILRRNRPFRPHSLVVLRVRLGLHIDMVGGLGEGDAQTDEGEIGRVARARASPVAKRGEGGEGRVEGLKGGADTEKIVLTDVGERCGLGKGGGLDD